MSALGRLTLHFNQSRDGRVKLQRTVFRRLDVEEIIEAERGAYDGTFKWSSGVKALMVFLLRSAAAVLRGTTDQEDDSPNEYVLEGMRPSLAASLNDVLTKRPVWIYDVFGTRGGDLPVLSEMVRRKNSDFSVDPASNVELWLDQQYFPGSKIEVMLNGRRLTEERELDTLAEAIATQWSPRGAASQSSASPMDQSVVSSNPTIVDSFQKLSIKDPGRSTLQNHFQMLFEMLSDDAEYHAIGMPELGFSGHWHGKQALVEAGSKMMSSTRDNDVRVNSLISERDTLAVFIEDSFYSLNAKRQIDCHSVMKLTFEGSKITQVYYLFAPN